MEPVKPITFNKEKWSWFCFFFGHTLPRPDNWARLISFQAVKDPTKTIDIAFFECGRCNKMQWTRQTR